MTENSTYQIDIINPRWPKGLTLSIKHEKNVPIGNIDACDFNQEASCKGKIGTPKKLLIIEKIDFKKKGESKYSEQERKGKT